MLGSSATVKIRAARLADAGELEHIYRTSWRNAYTGIIPYDRLGAVLLRRGLVWWRKALQSGDRLLLVEVLGKVGGYASFGPSRHGGPEEGEIYELYLSPVYQGIGLGELLFEACRLRLDRRGLKGLIVWVLSENHPARDFYIRRGGRISHERFDRSSGQRLEKVAYVWD